MLLITDDALINNTVGPAFMWRVACSSLYHTRLLKQETERTDLLSEPVNCMFKYLITSMAVKHTPRGKMKTTFNHRDVLSRDPTILCFLLIEIYINMYIKIHYTV